MKGRDRWLLIVASVFLLAGLIWLIYYIFVGRFYVYTDDAYVTGNTVMLTPQVSAGVKGIYADETDFVEKGQLIVELDSSNFKIRVEELEKQLADTVREVSALFQDRDAKKAQITLREAELKQAELDQKHRQPLVKTGAVSVEEFEIYETAVIVAAASKVYAEKEYEAAEVLVANSTVETHPRVQKAVWNLKQGYLDLIRCKIWAPTSGYLAKRTVQVGDQVAVGATLLFIIPLEGIWLEANYKETQLQHIRIGQPVTFSADMYGKEVKYHGNIIGFQPGTGNVFAALPPENAAGNWIKIIQRVPVRISIDPHDLQGNPLLLGLSLRVLTDVHDLDGKRLAPVATCTPLYVTEIYERQMRDLECYDSKISEIIRSNS